MNQVLSTYLKYFKTLNRGYNKGLGRAPHKPILLLSIIQHYKNNLITNNKIFITPQLVATFNSNFKYLVTTAHTANFALPFFHLKNEPFWRLFTKSGMSLALTKSRSIKSFKNLNTTIAYAEIDTQLSQLLIDKETNVLLEKFLLAEYFSLSDESEIHQHIFEVENEIENEILNEDAPTYRAKIKQLKKDLKEDDFYEEVFIRGGLFKKAIPQIYNYQCCISGMKIETTTNAQMVDACHIVPFSLSHDDTITNGISLSPNLHRAFDRGLITINKDYLVRISPTIKDNASVYSISQFNGKQIILPDNSKYYPSPEALSWHSKEVFQL
jgi:putative restriction endonuclease